MIRIEARKKVRKGFVERTWRSLRAAAASLLVGLLEEGGRRGFFLREPTLGGRA